MNKYQILNILILTYFYLNKIINVFNIIKIKAIIQYIFNVQFILLLLNFLTCKSILY